MIPGMVFAAGIGAGVRFAPRRSEAERTGDL